MTVYKICVCGDSNTGKTSFIRRLVFGTFTKEYSHTTNVDSHTLLVETTYGPMKFVLWDIPSDSSPEKLKHHFLCMNGAIILENFTELGKWGEYIRDSNSECPIINVINKCDHMKNGSSGIKQVMPVSVLNNFQLDLVINTLCRKLSGKNDLFITKEF